MLCSKIHRLQTRCQGDQTSMCAHECKVSADGNGDAGSEVSRVLGGEKSMRKPARGHTIVLSATEDSTDSIVKRRDIRVYVGNIKI